MWLETRRGGLVVLFAVLSSLSIVAAQETVYVNASNCPAPHPANPFCAIQDAICYLKNNVPAGGTVYVRPGTYAEAIRVFGGISVISTDGPAVTTINAAGRPCFKSDCTVNTATTSCAAVQSTSVGGVGQTAADHIEGFHIIGGSGYVWTTTPIAAVGGGIFVWGNSSPTITRNEIVGNTLASTATKAFYGGGIYVDSNIPGGTPAAHPVITKNLIEGNIVDPPDGNGGGPSYGIGAGIYSGPDAAPLIDDNTIRNNRSGDYAKSHQVGTGGGIAMYGRAAAGTPTVSKNTIQGNIAVNWGGGLQAGGSLQATYVGGVGVVQKTGELYRAVDLNRISTAGRW